MKVLFVIGTFGAALSYLKWESKNVEGQKSLTHWIGEKIMDTDCKNSQTTKLAIKIICKTSIQRCITRIYHLTILFLGILQKLYFQVFE